MTTKNNQKENKGLNSSNLMLVTESKAEKKEVENSEKTGDQTTPTTAPTIEELFKQVEQFKAEIDSLKNTRLTWETIETKQAQKKSIEADLAIFRAIETKLLNIKITESDSFDNAKYILYIETADLENNSKQKLFQLSNSLVIRAILDSVLTEVETKIEKLETKLKTVTIL